VRGSARHTFRSRAKLPPGRARTGHEEEIIHLAFRSRRNFPASLQVLMAQQKIQRSHLYLAQEVACTTSMWERRNSRRAVSLFRSGAHQKISACASCERRKKSERARVRDVVCVNFSNCQYNTAKLNDASILNCFSNFVREILPKNK
jgi:hypothetical protein